MPAPDTRGDAAGAVIGGSAVAPEDVSSASADDPLSVGTGDALVKGGSWLTVRTPLVVRLSIVVLPDIRGALTEPAVG